MKWNKKFLIKTRTGHGCDTKQNFIPNDILKILKMA